MRAELQKDVYQLDSVETRVALFGDLHVHSKLSFDSWIFGASFGGLSVRLAALVSGHSGCKKKGPLRRFGQPEA